MALEAVSGAVGTLAAKSPLAGILIVSFILMLLTTLVYKYFTNQEVLKRLKEENKSLSEEMKKNRDNPQRLLELQKQQMSKSLEPLKHQMKPMLITFIPFILVFGLLKNAYNGILVLGMNWFWAYLIFSIVFSMILRKLMKVH